MNFDMKELGAEFVGTFMLVASVCGAALFSAPNVGLIAIALSIGAAVLAMAYALGPISGAHFNPAVTCGLVAAGRFDMGKALPYIIAQVIGGVAAAVVFYVILQGAPASGKWNTFLAISNTYGGTGFPLLSVGLIEVVMTALYASVNPARSTATAIFGGAEAMQSLWLFWVAPIVGGIIGGLIGKAFYEE